MLKDKNQRPAFEKQGAFFIFLKLYLPLPSPKTAD